jgi:wobble nucleotide-excising tRNase
MIRKIISIANVGKLRQCLPQGNVEFKKLTLIYAPNGRGKTTLTDVVRSYQSGDGSFVEGRTTLGTTGAPAIELLTNSGTARFASGTWSVTDPNILVFDRDFIEQNVYSGSAVTHDNKRNLHQIIVGAGGVALANKVDVIDGQIRDANRELSEARAGLERIAPSGMTVEEFTALPAEADLANKITAQTREINALEQADAISKGPLITPLALPFVPIEFEATLNKTLDSVSTDVEQRVRVHLDQHTNGAGERWLSDGLSHVRGDVCPFCEQPLDPTGVIAVYRAYFSAAYNDLKARVAALRTSVARIAEPSLLLKVARDVVANTAGATFWSGFVKCELPPIDEGVLQGVLETLRDEAMALVMAKEQAPLEQIALTDGFGAAHAKYTALVADVGTFNDAASEINTRIEAKKAEMVGGDLGLAKTRLARLKAIASRHDSTNTAAVMRYATAKQQKTNLENNKVTAKNALDAHSGTVMAGWEKGLNTLLDKFGAEFQIGRAASQYRGGSPSATYSLMINGVAVELGAADSPRSQPNFRNTLSDGDRATLAFALFLLLTESDPNLADQVVLLDDPFSSQDRGRRIYTQQCIRRIASRASQVIVLSHNSEFLKLISDEWHDEQHCVELKKVGEKMLITECDLEAETASPYYLDHGKLQAFVEDSEGEPRDVARCIRPVLEHRLRVLFPGSFGQTEWLGDMIGKIRAAGSSDTLAAAQPLLTELEEINDFSKRYHHANWQAEPVDGDEVRTYSRRTLNLCRSL